MLDHIIGGGNSHLSSSFSFVSYKKYILGNVMAYRNVNYFSAVKFDIEKFDGKSIFGS